MGRLGHCPRGGRRRPARSAPCYRSPERRRLARAVDLIRRYDANPVLEASGWPGHPNAVFNPGAVRHDGQTVLIVRVEDRSGVSHLGVARSAGGLGGWTIEPEGALLPDPAQHAERWGFEDPRVTRIGDDFLIVCTGYSTDGPLIFLVVTRDFREYVRQI